METGNIFDEIEGYEDVKEQILANLQDGKKPVHFLFWGPPATAKTQFLDILATTTGSHKASPLTFGTKA